MSGEREYQPGDEFGAYALEQRLGGGGFGSVWRARHRENGQLVAVKILNASAYATDTVALRSEVELLAATASSRSSHVVRVLGGGAEPKPHVVMEFIDGVDLSRELDRRGRIPQLETIRIGRAVADALAALQDVGIIHRDVKPANVMIDVDGVVKLTDFGIAKIVGFDTITATSQMPMSMAYAAPEVWEGSASHRSDIYSLGILIFQCLAGRPPFTGSYAQVYRQHSTKDPDWSLLPEGTVPALRDLLRMCLAKVEDERPAGGAEVEAQLAEAERQLLTRATPSETQLPAHEPQAFGPWLRQSAHPTQPWAFVCTHETSGEKATVEIHFSDGIEYGADLRKAVAANPKLVPLGAERLLGTNRLVLRPGEAWTNAPTGQFQFWVAREALPRPKTAQLVDAALLRTAAANALRMESAAASAGISLAWRADSAFLLETGDVFIARPGLTYLDEATIEDWFSQLPLTARARSLLGSKKLRQIADDGTTPTTKMPDAGVATPAETSYRSEPTEAVSEIADWSNIRSTAAVDDAIVRLPARPASNPPPGLSAPPPTPDSAATTIVAGTHSGLTDETPPVVGVAAVSDSAGFHHSEIVESAIRPAEFTVSWTGSAPTSAPPSPSAEEAEFRRIEAGAAMPPLSTAIAHGSGSAVRYWDGVVDPLAGWYRPADAAAGALRYWDGWHWRGSDVAEGWYHADNGPSGVTPAQYWDGARWNGFARGESPRPTDTRPTGYSAVIDPTQLKSGKGCVGACAGAVALVAVVVAFAAGISWLIITMIAG